MENFTHWKKEANTNYLGSWDLIVGADEVGKPIYKEVNVIVAKIEKQAVPDMDQIKKGKANATKDELLVWFDKFEQPMIIHAKCNFKGLEKATGTPFIEKWLGKVVCVYVEENVKAFGTTTDALRIKPAVKRLCCICGKVIDEKLYIASVNKYGRAFCGKDCFEKSPK